MIHFLVLDSRAWLGRLHGVKKLKLHKQNDLDTKKKQRKIQGKIAAVRFMTAVSTSLRYEVREKKESGSYLLDRLTDRWQPTKVLFLKTAEEQRKRFYWKI